MCVAVNWTQVRATASQLSQSSSIDTSDLREILAANIGSGNEAFPPFILITSTDGCKVDLSLSADDSRVSRPGEEFTDDLVMPVPGTELVDQTTLVATDESVQVVSVTLVDFVDHAPGQSLLHRLCDGLIDFFCRGQADGDLAECRQFLGPAVCYPSEGDEGYLKINLYDLGRNTGVSLVAVRVVDDDWRVSSPWRSVDVVWMLLWLLPVWATVLFLPALAMRRACSRPSTVLLELERALNTIEVEKKQRRFLEAEVRVAVRHTRWIARTLLLLAILLLPWLPAWVVIPVALPLSRSNLNFAAWVKSRPSRYFWLAFGAVCGLVYGAWLLASWGLTYGGVDRHLTLVGDISDSVKKMWFVSECDQLIGSTEGVESIGGYVYPTKGKVCSTFLRAVKPENAPYIAWVLFAQGCVSLLLSAVSLALLLRAAGRKAIPGGCKAVKAIKAIPGGSRFAAAFRCGAPSVDGLLASNAEGASDRFAGSAKELVTGQPEEAATGLYGIIGHEEAYLREKMATGTAAIIEEAEALGDPEVLENLRYILDASAGSSATSFHNGWRRDRAPDGSRLGGRQGMVLADFVALPVARRAKLEEAHVVALRLYSTAAFRALNGPMRNLKMSHCRKGEDGSPLPLEPPQLAAPHPQPVTMAFIYEALKRMRAVAAATSVDLAGQELEEQGLKTLAVAGELSLSTLRQARSELAGCEEGLALPIQEEGGDEESSVIEEGRATVRESLVSGVGADEKKGGERWAEEVDGDGAHAADGGWLRAAVRALGCARPAKQEEGRILWRGMGDLRAPPRFLSMGGTEFACCSTTSRLEVAARYASAAGKQRALLFRLKSSTFMNMGVDISEFSAFPHEKEYLYPPLTYMHPTGVTHTLVRDGVTFDVVEVEPSFPS